METMYVYSGECRMGVCGEKTGLTDSSHKPLFVGDIVESYSVDEMGVCDSHGLTVVVSDRFTSYSDGTHVEKEGDVTHFVMGIKNVDFMGSDAERWMVRKLKSHQDVVDGEKWRDFGFNYSKK